MAQYNSAWDPFSGTNSSGAATLNPYNIAQPNTYGLNPSFLNTQSNNTANYNSPNGNFSSNNDGNWQSGSMLSPQINNLSGYLGMKGQQTSGSNFTGYKSQLDNLIADPNSVQKSAGYQFAVDQGNQAIDRSAAARGMSNSGGVLAELAKYGSGMGAQNYNSQVNQLFGLMQGAQNFGINSGNYNPAQYTPSLGITSQTSGVGSYGLPSAPMSGVRSPYPTNMV